MVHRWRQQQKQQMQQQACGSGRGRGGVPGTLGSTINASQPQAPQGKGRDGGVSMEQKLYRLRQYAEYLQQQQQQQQPQQQPRDGSGSGGSGGTREARDDTAVGQQQQQQQPTTGDRGSSGSGDIPPLLSQLRKSHLAFGGTKESADAEYQRLVLEADFCRRWRANEERWLAERSR